MDDIIKRNPIRSLIIAILIAIFLWLVFAPWPPELVAKWGRKQIFLNALLGGITLGACISRGCRLHADFRLMRVVNLAHGSLFLLGGYLGYEISNATGSWFLAFPIVFIVVGLLGLLMQRFIFAKMEGEELRQTLVSIGISIVLADIMLWFWGGQSYSILAPAFLQGPMELPIINSINANTGATNWLRYPRGSCLDPHRGDRHRGAMWLVLNRTALGMLIRAGRG